MILTCNSSIIIIIIITIFLRSFYKNTTRKKIGRNAHGPCYTTFFRVFYEAAQWGGKENAREFSSAAKGESRDPPNCCRTGGPLNWYRLSNSHQSPHGRTEEASLREHSRQREREVGKRRKKVEDRRTHRLIVHATTPARSSTPAPSSTQ